MDIVRRITLTAFWLLSSTPICTPALADQGFSTKQGLGFDKQISIWLIEKYITPSVPVIFYIGDIPPAQTLTFDETDSQFLRTADHSTYEQLVEKFAPGRESLDYLVKTVSDIEINLWQPDSLSDSIHAENAFRALQEKWGRESVPRQCYREYFDGLEQLINTQKSLKDAGQLLSQLQCWQDALKQKTQDPQTLVPSIPIATLMGYLRSGAKVAFIDVRETDEFAENHIPGAVNFLIKDANPSSVESLKQYDLVVAYCIKDFRGFEMARKLKKLGITQAAILNPYGIKGWIDSGLPVFQQNKTNEVDAANMLQSCLNTPRLCQPKMLSH